MSPFLLRPWRIDDLAPLVRYANDPGISGNLTDAFPHPYTEEHGKRFIEMAMSHDPMRIFCIEVNGEAAGGIGVHPQTDIMRRNAELGYWLARPHWGQGIISAAIPKAVEYGFRTFDIDRIYARPFGRNVASQRTLEKNGFVLEARLNGTIIKNGVIEDELIYAVRR
jgi:[ribosomal protein S5]-alanine N-acetyltransferase